PRARRSGFLLIQVAVIPKTIGQMPADTELHRALADPRRRELVEMLEAAGDGLDVPELARRLRLHPNTVRWHLGILGDAGIVTSSAAPRSGPGRPRIVYRLSAESRASGREEYRLLASILAGTVSAKKSGPRRAEASGRAWGRHLVR